MGRTALAIVVALVVSALPLHAQSGDTTEAMQDASDQIASAAPAWKGALSDSIRLVLMQHSIRIAFQAKTRGELGGTFFRDYRQSIRIPKSWNDGDGWLVNYLGHPVQGATAGFIWLDHDWEQDAAAFSKQYWSRRGRALLWAAAYSLQFEFGPLSEASIGNVGLRPDTTGWVDHVITPVGALGLMIGEDSLDRYLLARLEDWIGNRAVQAVLRIVLSPSRSISNVVQGRAPWHRAERPFR